jgi:hypothetical protein
MTDKTIHEQAQFALESLNCSHLDAGIHGLSSVLNQPLEPGRRDSPARDRSAGRDRLGNLGHRSHAG